MLKWKFITSFVEIAPVLIQFRVEMAMVCVKRQFNRTASQMCQIWFKSSWESRRSPKQLILGHFKWDD